MAGQQLTFKNGQIITTQDGAEIHYAPMIVLDCVDCSGWTTFEQESATQVVCESCGGVQSNEGVVDLNDERL